MGPTFTLLAAGLLAAQTAEPPTSTPAKTCNCQKNATSGHIQPVAAPESTGSGFGLFRAKNEPQYVEERPSLWSKITGAFKKSDASEPAVYRSEPPIESNKTGPFRLMNRLPAGQPTPEPSLSIPNPVPAAPVKVTPITYQAVPPGQPAPTPTPTTGSQITPTSGTAIKSTELPPSRPNRVSPELVNKIGHEADYSWITGQLRIENGLYVIHYATPETVDRFNGSLVLSSDQDLRAFHDGDYVSVRGSVATGNGRTLYRVNQINRLPR